MQKPKKFIDFFYFCLVLPFFIPDWCCVIAIIAGALCFIIGCVIAGRSCCINYEETKPVTQGEIDAINEAMKIDEQPDRIYLGPQARRTAEYVHQHRLYV